MWWTMLPIENIYFDSVYLIDGWHQKLYYKRI